MWVHVGPTKPWDWEAPQTFRYLSKFEVDARLRLARAFYIAHIVIEWHGVPRRGLLSPQLKREEMPHSH